LGCLCISPEFVYKETHISVEGGLLTLRLERKPMTAKELENLRRRELLAKLGKLAVAVPALQALSACASDPVAAANPASPGAAGTTGTSTAPVATAGNTGTATAPSSGSSGGTGATAGRSGGPAAGTAGASAAGSGPIATAGTDAAPIAGAGGAGAASSGVSVDSLACVVSPALTEGPFFVDMQMERSNLIEEDEPGVSSGVPLDITFGVFKVDGTMCEPIAGATVDIWHCDTQGVYSNVSSETLPMTSFIQPQDTGDKKYCRGWQKTGEDGVAKFRTIYPGWYGSRCIHIHFKVRGQMGVQTMDFTSQIFFDDALNAEVLMTPGYKQGPPAVTNRTDMVYTTGDGGALPAAEVPASTKVPGDELMVKLTKTADGYEGAFLVGLMV
jgi:protocatechuate 3,4-dioxygenase beta subunit